MSLGDVQNLAWGTIQGLASSVAFVLALLVGFCVVFGLPKLKKTAGGDAKVIKSLDELIRDVRCSICRRRHREGRLTSSEHRRSSRPRPAALEKTLPRRLSSRFRRELLKTLTTAPIAEHYFVGSGTASGAVSPPLLEHPRRPALQASAFSRERQGGRLRNSPGRDTAHLPNGTLIAQPCEPRAQT